VLDEGVRNPGHATFGFGRRWGWPNLLWPQSWSAYQL